MRQPKTNSYVITVTLRGVSKQTAREFATDLEFVAQDVGAPFPEVQVAHLKFEQTKR